MSELRMRNAKCGMRNGDWGLGIVEEETDEALYWLELLTESQMVQEKLIASLYKEGTELLAITVSSIKTAKRNR